MELKAEEFGMSAKAEDLMRQQYLVPRKSVKKLREMSRREGVSAGELARRAIEAYTSGNVIPEPEEEMASRDRKSTRLNSSHQIISYAVFCLKKKTTQNHTPARLHTL